MLRKILSLIWKTFIIGHIDGYDDTPSTLMTQTPVVIIPL